MATDEAVQPTAADPPAAAPPAPPAVPDTHPAGFYFIFAGEFAERCSFYGMRAILPLYMADQLDFGEAAGGRFYFFFLAACYFLPLAGGYIADRYLGKYWTIVGFSVPYVVGHLILGIEHPVALVVALALLAMGTGVTKPNISTLMGLTYDQYRPGQDKLRSNAFQYFYMAINIGAFLSQVAVPVVRDQTGSYATAFAVPAVLMVVALGLFAAGKPYYATEGIPWGKPRPPEPPERTVAKVRVLGQVALLFALVSFFWAVFDQSSATWVYFAKTYMDLNLLGYPLAPDSVQALNPFFIVAIIGPLAVYRTFVAGSVGESAMSATTKMLIGFLLTAACMGVMAVAGYLTGAKQPATQVKCKEIELFLPLGGTALTAARTTYGDGGEAAFANQGGAVTFPDGAGSLTFPRYTSAAAGKVTFPDGRLALSNGKALVFTAGHLDLDASKDALVGGLADGKLTLPGVLEFTVRQGKYQLPDGVLVVRRGNLADYLPGERLKVVEKVRPAAVAVEAGEYVPPGGRVSVLWMALAFFVLTVAEVLISVTGLELAFVVAPPDMKGFVTACWLLTVAFANFFINAPIADLYPDMHPGDYFLMLAVAGLVVAGLFVPVSRRFNKAMAEARAERPAAVEANGEAI